MQDRLCDMLSRKEDEAIGWLMRFQQVSHSLFVSVQSTNLVYLWKQEHITDTKGWLSTYLRFVSEVKNFFWSKLLKQGKKAGTLWSVSLQTHRHRSLGKKVACGDLGLSTLVAESAKESRQAIAVSRHVVTRSIAVHTLRACLTAVVSVKARGTNWRPNKINCYRFSEDFPLPRAWEFSLCLNPKPIFLHL